MKPTELRELAERTIVAMQTFIEKRQTLHVPPRPTDPDMVIGEAIDALRALADEKERAVGGITNSVVCEVLRKYEVNDFDTDDVEAMRAALESAALALQSSERLRELAKKWRATSINAPHLRRYARYECADELSALLGE